MAKAYWANATADYAELRSPSLTAATDFWVAFRLGFHAVDLAWWTSANHELDFASLRLSGGTNLRIYLVDPAIGDYWYVGNTQGSVPNPAAEEWLECEVHYSSVTDIVSYYINGTLVVSGEGVGATGHTLGSLRIGDLSETSNDIGASVYFTNVTVGTTRGGTDVFQDDFSSGTFAAWATSLGNSTIITDPFTPVPGNVNEGAGTAADVPSRFDVVINGYGYMLLQSLESSVPFRTHRSVFTSTQTFVERNNVGAAYGDNTQDFFLVVSQNDWSLGENQKYFRVTDADRVRRYWTGTNLDPISVPGQVTLRQATGTLSFQESAVTAAARVGSVYVAGSTTLSQVQVTGATSVVASHGLGVAPSKFGIAVDADGQHIYLSSSATGTTGIVRGLSFGSFSSSGCDSLVVLNNTLYGIQETTGQLLSFDTVGAPTTIYTWKTATGTAVSQTFLSRMRTLGGKLEILRPRGEHFRGEIWEYDGTSTKMVVDLPSDFEARDMEVGSGIIFVSGFYLAQQTARPAILYYVNGTLGELWRAATTNSTNTIWPAMAAFGPGLLFTDDTNGHLMQYSVALGGVHTVGTYTASNGASSDIAPILAASNVIAVHTRQSTTGYYYPTTSYATSGTLSSSLFDFDNSLPKAFRSIKVDWVESPGGSVSSTMSLAYVLDSLDGTYASLANSIVSGTEYTLPAATVGQAIGYKVTFARGSGSPALQRVYIRGAPLLQTYKHREYILDLSGIGYGEDSIHLADGTPHPLTGFEQAANLMTAVASTSPISITDQFGTYTCLLEPGDTEIMRSREGWENHSNPGAYVARVTAREV